MIQRGLVCLALLALAAFAAPVVRADESDSAASAAAGFAALAPQSKGIVIRVPVNDQGEVNTDAAEMKVVETAEPAEAADLLTMYPLLRDAGGVAPQVDPAVAETDSSTRGWRHGWHSYGWRHANYYHSYMPTYYYGGYNYSYSYRYSYTRNYGGWGYCYNYYRPRWW